MQQHTGQHVLSAAFDRLFGVRTRELSPRRGRVDDRSRARDVAAPRSPRPKTRPTASSGRTARSAIRFAIAEEAAQLPLRKEPARGGTLRLIDVEGFDLSACGGTHVARTGGDRHDRRRRRGSGSRAASGSSSCAAAARSRAYGSAARRDRPRASGCCPSCRMSCPPRSSGCRRTQGSRSERWRRCSRISRATARRSSPRVPS